MSGLLIRRVVIFTILGVVGLLILLAIFFVASLVANWLYYALGPRLTTPPVPLPGPTGVDLIGLEGLAEILLYVLFILGAIGGIVAAIAVVRWLDRERTRETVYRRDELQPDAC